MPAKATFSDEFPEAQALRDSATRALEKRPLPASNGHAVDEDTPKRARRGSPMIQAIVVDDDEVGDSDDYDDDSSDLDHGHNHKPHQHNGHGHGNDNDDDDDDESDIEQVYPDGKGGFARDRYQSVSEDEFDDPAGSPSEDDSSRYSIKQPKVKAEQRAASQASKEEGELDSDDEDGKKGRAAKRERRKRNKDFWAAKGGSGLPSSEDSDAASE